jgi:hypothetical protein
MSLGDIRTAIQGAMQEVPSVGIVNDFEPWARREEEFRRYFFDRPLEHIRGWTITRQATEEIDNTLDGNFSTHLMVIRGYRALADGASTERDFQDLIEAIRTRLRAEQYGHFGGVCTLVGPPQVRVVEVRSFSDYLVHYAEITVECMEQFKVIVV